MRVAAVVSELNEPLYVDLTSLGIPRRLLTIKSDAVSSAGRSSEVREGRCRSEGLSGGEAKKRGGTCVDDLLSRCSGVAV